MQSVPKISKFDRRNDHLIIRLWTIQMKGSAEYFHVVLFIVLRNEFLTCETVARKKSLILTNYIKGAGQKFSCATVILYSARWL